MKHQHKNCTAYFLCKTQILPNIYALKTRLRFTLSQKITLFHNFKLRFESGTHLDWQGFEQMKGAP
jgi:hypothetical protein